MINLSRLALVLVIVCLSSFGGLAVEPQSGQSYRIAETGWQWELIEGESLAVNLFSAKGESVAYDISECTFCSGEADNCDANGIYVVNLPNHEPAIAVICHKGAHSQRLKVFAPLRDMTKTVFEVTGDYWVNYEPQKLGFKVTYDRRQDFDTSKDANAHLFTLKWPKNE